MFASAKVAQIVHVAQVQVLAVIHSARDLQLESFLVKERVL